MNFWIPVFAEQSDITKMKHPDYTGNLSDWQKYRATFKGGHDFVNDYVVKYSDIGKHRKMIAHKTGDKPTGVGGDDKCGIFTCFHALDSLENVKVMFFSNEEVGCRGSGGLHEYYYSDIGYMLQADRWGRSDFIDKYSGDETTSEEFKEKTAKIKEKFGYNSATGLHTDVMKLFSTKKMGVSVANISCGYYEHHTDNEFIDVNELWNCSKFIVEMCKTLGEEKYPAEPVPYTKKYTGGSYHGDRWSLHDDYLDDWDWHRGRVTQSKSEANKSPLVTIKASLDDVGWYDTATLAAAHDWTEVDLIKAFKDDADVILQRARKRHWVKLRGSGSYVKFDTLFKERLGVCDKVEGFSKSVMWSDEFLNFLEAYGYTFPTDVSPDHLEVIAIEFMEVKNAENYEEFCEHCCNLLINCTCKIPY